MDAIIKWLAQSVYYFSILLSLAIAGGGVAVYVLFHRYIYRGKTADKVDRAYSRLVGFGITIIVAALLARVWHGRLVFLDAVQKWFVQHAVFGSIVWTVVALIIVYFLSRVIEPVLLRDASDISSRHKVRRAVYWGRTMSIILVLLLIWAARARNVGMFLGIVGAGIALSLQESILCIAGWMLIIIKQPFDIGDRIEIDGHKGDVIDIRVFQSSLLEIGNWVDADQSTGRIINFPNSFVFRKVNFNYSKGFPFIWNEIAIAVTFESDWKKAKEIILGQAEKEAAKIEQQVAEYINRMQSAYAVRYQKLTPIVYTSIADQGVMLTLRYLTPVRKRRGTGHQLAEGILVEFAKHDDIDFAYPTTRFYNNILEGKPGTGGKSEKPLS